MIGNLVCADVALFLRILELVFADVLPNLFGQFGPGEWVFADHCGQCGVGLHGFAKGMFAQADAVSATPPCVNDIAG